MVSAEDVIEIYQLLAAQDIQVWLTGGWGIDALLGEQTRPHKDLDVIVLLADIPRIHKVLGDAGFRLKELWSENRWATDAGGNPVATAFVLWDSDGREFDAHAITFDEQGVGIPAWAEAENFHFSPEDLAGAGTVAGYSVQCISPAMQVLWHTGYDLPAAHLQDMKRLRARFGLEPLNP